MPTDFQETYEERGHATDRYTEDDFGHYLSLLSDKERIWAYEHCVNDLPPRMIAKKIQGVCFRSERLAEAGNCTTSKRTKMTKESLCISKGLFRMK